MKNYQEILTAALLLPIAQRIEMISALGESIPTNEFPKVSQQWISETQRRSEAYDAGRLTGTRWSEVRKRARIEAGLEN